MSDDEAAHIYSALAELMRNSRLDWVVVQVEEQVALGKVSTKRLSVREDPLSFGEYKDAGFPLRGTRRAPVTFALSEEYSNREKLILLLEGLESAVPQLNRIADYVIDFYGREVQSRRLTFSPEAEVKEAFDLSTEDVANTKEASDRLLALLQELRREVGDAH